MASKSVQNDQPPLPDDIKEQTEAAKATRQDAAKGVIRRSTYWALGIGLVPLPLVDLVALTAVQVKMLKEISDIYEVKFFEDKAKTIVGVLIAGLGGLSLTAMVARSLFRVVPVVGGLVAAVSLPVVAGAITTAVGNVFIMHFEAGGTLLDFDAKKMREYFRKEFDKAKDVVKNMQKQGKSSTDEKVAP